MKKQLFSAILFLAVSLFFFSFSPAFGQKSRAEELKEMVTTAKITLTEALNTALKTAPGKAVAGELEKEKGKLIFTFDILPSISSSIITEVQVDAITGKVISQAEEKIKAEEEEEEKEEKKGEKEEAEKEEPKSSLQEIVAAAKISLPEALKAAQAAVSGTVIAAELEKEKGKIIFSFDILPTPGSQIIQEVHIDALTGKVIAKEEEKIK